MVGGIGHGVATDYQTGNVYFANSTVPIRPKGFATADPALAEGLECFKRFAFVNSQYHYAIRPIGLACLMLKDGRWRRVGPVNAPMSIFDDFTNHCPGGFGLIRLPGGRLWSFLDHNGHAIRSVGVRASYSDDNGLTWTPSHRTRWVGPPGSYMRPFFVAPYKDHVAMIAGVAGEKEPIRRISVPHVSPPDYVALVWANKRPKANWLRFIKIPNAAGR